MKIEKINDNQIRCTLTKEDLASRQLKISELAYGTEKAKNLFRDMMRQANYEFGFEAEDIPLMIEAVPMSADCIVLIITKVEDPEELDTRFSRFAPSVHEETDLIEDDVLDEVCDGLEDLLNKIHPSDNIAGEDFCEPSETLPENKPLFRLFAFPSLRPLFVLTGGLKLSFPLHSTLYKDTKNQRYLLLLSGASQHLTEYNKLCNRLSEYGTLLKVQPTTEAYLSEHCETILPSDALMTLAETGSGNTSSET